MIDISSNLLITFLIIVILAGILIAVFEAFNSKGQVGPQKRKIPRMPGALHLEKRLEYLGCTFISCDINASVRSYSANGGRQPAVPSYDIR